jgi:hypothetical protein
MVLKNNFHNYFKTKLGNLLREYITPNMNGRCVQCFFSGEFSNEQKFSVFFDFLFFKFQENPIFKKSLDFILLIRSQNIKRF